MPRLSDTMSEGSISRWLKKPGDKVEVGDIVAEIETDKATMELEAFEAGFLQQILVAEGQVVPIGQTIGLIGSTPDAPSAAAPAPPTTTAAPASPPAATPATPVAAVAEAPASETDGHIKASPLARRLATEFGIDLRLVSGTGPGGRVLKENVEAFAAQRGNAVPVTAIAPTAATAPVPAEPTPVAKAPTPVAPPAPAPKAPTSAESEAMGRMRKAIARAMNESKPGIPHIYITIEVDMAAAMALRQQINDSGAAPVKISVNDLVVKATAKALQKVPTVNSSYALTADGQPGAIKHTAINVSVAVALEDGLTAPVVKDADKKSIGTIGAEIRDLAARAREGKLKQNELEGATFQVTNLGMFDVVEFGSIITVGQGASLAVGSVRQVPVVRNGEIVVGQVMNVTLSADHRVIDGAVGAQYLQELRKLLETPMGLLV
jgi:pyruvate dehydrogenase E2 component (dihydrolipoamide acetyltransferase)